MNQTTAPSAAPVWAAIERDRRLDRRLRRLAALAWGTVLLILLVYAAMTGMQLVHTLRLLNVGAATDLAVLATATPFVIAVGVLALLVAALCTVGIFLRLRTASLGEIQQRLAALEALLLGRGDAL